ncbi:NCS2 family permease [Orenia marismortui]|uniref:NCS2 family permease n=1 Tax=Orenia marismortui TaxID=46469 RepID=UPI000375E936|nr:NCS2 family permease [Orenia marismortui]
MTALLEKVFLLKENNTNVKTEIFAGITTFMTMAYIIFVNPNIVSATGMPVEALMIATAMSAAFGTLCMAFFSNYPFALAPGMGINAYFTYTVVLKMGLSWQQALGTVFVSGIIFVILSVTKVRETIINSMPKNLKLAISAGMGLFIALLGMENAGIVVNSQAILVDLGDLTAPATLLALVGIIITIVLMARKIHGAILLGILATTVIGIPFGIVEMPETIIKVPSFSTWEPIFFKADIMGVLNLGILPVIFSFLFVDIFDTAGALIGVSQQAGFLDKDGNLPKVNRALLSDSMGTIAGALMGTPTVTTYVESATGVAEGGRTGLTGVTVALCFVLSIFFAPVVAIVPAAATAPALIIVGSLMMKNAMHIDWDKVTEAIPAFITLIAIPFTYSITNGISLGFIIYPIVKYLHGEGEDVHWIISLFGFLFVLKYIYM